MNNILIIDDTKSNIDLLLELLKNYNIFVATDGKSGLEILNESKIDLVLLDIMMPEMDGYEVCKIIRNTPKIKDIPIIFLTAKSQEEDIEKAYELGGNDYITKPFKEKELLARIDIQLKIKEHNKILNDYLIQQSKMAQMGEMIDSIAHQWKQPLNIISLSTQVLEYDFYENNIDKEYITNFKQNISMQINHLLDTLNEFRNFFRPTNNIENFNVKEAIQKVLLLLNDEIEKHGIKIQINETSPYIIKGSENEFKHIVINLLNNSKEAFIEKNITQRNFTININGDKKYIEFIDNAGGIPKEVIEHIFDINYTTKTTGTGMGLYMSSQIANKLSAKLEVENIQNGVKFIFKENN